MLAHPSVHVLGHRDDVPDLMRRRDAFVLPSLEEGFPLACVEAIASGCVPLVSDACSEACTHRETGLVHHVGDVEALRAHITALHEDRELLERLQAGCLEQPASSPGSGRVSVSSAFIARLSGSRSRLEQSHRPGRDAVAA